MHKTNIDRFNKAAATWEDKPNRVELARKVAQAIKHSLPLNQTMEAMEYGCGTGLVSRSLCSEVKCITCCDSSPEMLAVLQQKADAEGINNIIPLELDLTVDQSKAQQYDLLFCSMTLHHVSDVDTLLDKFLLLIKPGGYLALADLDQEDGSFHDDDSGVAHKGISRSRLIANLEQRGLQSITANTAHTINKHGKEYPVFLVAGQMK